MLAECEICGQSTGKLYSCNRCGARFCRYCGSFTEKMCIDCIEHSGSEVDEVAVEVDKPGKVSEAKA